MAQWWHFAFVGLNFWHWQESRVNLAFHSALRRLVSKMSTVLTVTLQEGFCGSLHDAMIHVMETDAMAKHYSGIAY